MKMRKALIVALALMSLDTYFVAIAKAAENKCEARMIKCNNICAAGRDTEHNCFSRCSEEYDLCEEYESGPKSDVRTIKSKTGAANTKNIPPVSSGTNTGGNTNPGTTLGASGTSGSTPTKPASSSSPGGGSPTSVSGGSGLTNRKPQ
jgi:hypothetical protein